MTPEENPPAFPKFGDLHPIGTSHPASCAYWITCSPHEWTWTQSDQEAMAKTIVNLRRDCGEAVELLLNIITDSARSCHIERQARTAVALLGFDADAMLAARKGAA